jgi:hypothetical protein
MSGRRNMSAATDRHPKEHKCTEQDAVIRRLHEWEKEMERKWGKGWHLNPNRPVSIIHDLKPPAGVNVIISGSKITGNSISLREWLSKGKQSSEEDLT